MKESMKLAKELLFNFEKKYNPYLLVEKKGEYTTWVLVREKLFKKINILLSPEEQIQSQKSLSKKISYQSASSFLFRVLDYYKKRKTLNEKIDILFITNSYFRRGENSENIFIDGIIDELSKDLNVKVLEIPTFTEYDQKYKSSRHFDKIVPLDFYIPKGSLYMFFYKTFKKSEITKSVEDVFKNTSKEGFDKNLEFRSDKPKYLEDKVLIDFIKPIWIKEITKFRSWEKTFSPLFEDITAPTVVDLANASRFAKVILPKGTEFIEIQHGIIHPYHLSYIYPNLNSVKESVLKNKKIITHGKYYTDLLINSSQFDSKNVETLGNPLYSNYKDNNFSDKDILMKKLNLDNDKKIILITSQYERRIQDVILNFVRELHEIVSEEYVIVIKLHLREVKEKIYIEFNEIKNIRVTLENPSLLELLSCSLVHISVSSTVILEAILFDLPNVIIKTDFSGYIDELFGGKVLSIDKATDLLEYLNKIESCSTLSKDNENLKAQFFGNNKDTNLKIAKRIEELHIKK
jgi:hypothetical protein